MRIWAASLIGTVLFSATVLQGQQISGTITGAVKDSQQASIANAKVTVTNQEQGTTRDALTAVDGSFVFAQLQPGTYNIAVEAAGFKKFEQTDDPGIRQRPRGSGRYRTQRRPAQ